MSSIFGIAYPDGRPVAPHELQALDAALAGRGPDGGGLWHGDGVGLGFRWLQTLPETEQQPLTSHDGRLTLVAQVRLDNRAALMHNLGLADPQLADSAILLAAYQRWGAACLNRLMGDFAFAVWDAEQHRLFAARDHFGVRPFYYHSAQGALAFASSARALHHLAWVPHELNEQWVMQVLLFRPPRSPITAFVGIERLAPAHYLTFSPDGLHVQRYWSPADSPSVRFANDDDYVAGFREMFTEAVRSRLRTPKAVGAFLSGGLDSSSVACTIRHLQPERPLPTFSAVFSGIERSDEAAELEAVLASGGFEPHRFVGHEISTIPDPASYLNALEEPLFTPNLFIGWQGMKLAQAAGIGVMLDGFDGDTAVSHGFGYIAELAAAQNWQGYQAEIEAISKRYWGRQDAAALKYAHTNYGFPSLAAVAKRGQWWKLPSMVKHLSAYSHVSRRAIVRNHVIRPLLPERVLRWRHTPTAYQTDPLQPSLVERHRRRLHDFMRPPASVYTERDGHIQAVTSWAIPTAFEWSERRAAAFGIETRHPFYDRRVVEYCIGLPAEQKLHDGWGRYILRRAMAGILPPSIQWRTNKANLGRSYVVRYHQGERAAFYEAVFGQDTTEFERYIDRAAFERLHTASLDSTDLVEVLRVWIVLAFGLWLQHVQLTQ